MNATEFITIAGRVIGLGKAGPRTAISRAYYGLFHIARSLVEEFTAETYGSGKSHNLIPQFIEEAAHPTGITVARMLGDLHTERIKADYRLNDESTDDVEFAKVCVETALYGQRLLEQFRQECLADPQLLQNLRDGVARVKAIHKV